jgi:hypothetical protein
VPAGGTGAWARAAGTHAGTTASVAYAATSTGRTNRAARPRTVGGVIGAA